MSFKKSIINARISGSGGSSGPETVKTYTGNVCYVLKSVLKDLSGSAVAQALQKKQKSKESSRTESEKQKNVNI